MARSSQGPETRDASGGSPAPSRREAPPLRSGELLAGRFRVGRLLGRGGMGEVFEAHDVELDVPVALKRLRPDVARGADALLRLKREVLLARTVSHPNVCRLHDAFRHQQGGDDVTFLTMELLRGDTLAQRLRRRGPHATADALPIVRPLGDALRAIHRAGAVHRDVKSSNVMLVPDGDGERVVLTDFGLATAALEGDGALGTPPYMAPEQFHGGAVGPTADIHALGVVLHEIVTARLPGERRREADDEPVLTPSEAPSPRLLAPDLPAAWEEAILKCLRRDPAERFQRVEDLIAFLEGGSVAQAPSGYRLPAEGDSFVGRPGEMEVVGRHLAEDRVVTLVGAPGAGKSRLALHFAWHALGDFSGGAWWCDLTLARGVEGLAACVASSLDVPLLGGDLVDRLGHVLAARGRVLLVLDNAETVVAPARAVLETWTARALEARVLVTSRERLALASERVVALDALSEEEAIALFVERARETRPGFGLDATSAGAIADVVRLLDGQPLAIELAAARLRSLTLEQVRERLERRLELLVSARDAGHHVSLEAAIDASWQLLAPWEQDVFAHCAVFEGGVALGALEDVAELAKWPHAPPVVDIVRTLADKSLVRVARADGEPRIALLASLHDFAGARLDDARTAADGASRRSRAEQRHGACFATLGTEEAIDRARSDWAGEARRRLVLELPNLLAACRRAVARRDARVAARACVAACEVLSVQGPYRLGLELGETVLALPGLEPRERARVLLAVGPCMQLDSHARAMETYARALPLARELADPRLEGAALSGLGLATSSLGRREEGATLALSALDIAARSGELVVMRRAHATLGYVRELEGRVDEAITHYASAMEASRLMGDEAGEASFFARSTNQRILARLIGPEEAFESLARCAELGRRHRNRHVEAHARISMGVIRHNEGRLREAREHYETGLRSAREAGARGMEGKLLANLAGIDFHEGRLAAAQAGFEASAAVLASVGDRHAQANDLGAAAAVARRLGRSDEARAILEQALRIEHCGGSCGGHGGLAHELAAQHLEAGRLEEAGHALARAEALLRRHDKALKLIGMLDTRGMYELALGMPDRARSTLAEAEAIAGSLQGVDYFVGVALGELRQALACRGTAGGSGGTA